MDGYDEDDARDALATRFAAVSRRSQRLRRYRALTIALTTVTGIGGCERATSVATADSAEVSRATGVPAATRIVAYGAGALGDALDYTPPPESAIPDDEMGASIRRGLALITHTTDSLPRYAPGNLQCVSCHLDAGRRRDAAPLIGVTARFPKYMDRTGAVIPVEDRVNYCFTRSLAGNRLPNNSREMQDIVAYLAYISTGVPQGAHVLGESMPKMPKLTADTTRGAQLFRITCVACHGTDGQGNGTVIPALWGPKSYSIGASMSRTERAASFIFHFMPKSKPGSLSVSQAFDVAAYINAQPRPDSPGKERDWPHGGTPSDVPYATSGHDAFLAPARLFKRANPAGAVVPAPASVVSAGSPLR